MSYPELTFERGDVLEATWAEHSHTEGTFPPISDGDRVVVTGVFEEGEEYRASYRRGFNYVICGEDEERTMRVRGVSNDGSKWSYSNGLANTAYKMSRVEPER